ARRRPLYRLRRGCQRIGGRRQRLRHLLPDHRQRRPSAGRAGPLVGQGLSAGQVYQALREGHPVVAWVSYDYASHPRTDYAAFDGAVIPYAGAVEHAVTLVGLAPGQVLIFDPDQGPLWLARSTFETAYQTFDEMAVELA